ncbi:MAG: cation diffusion facilitator family transporter [Nitrososphaerales archaeon]
MSQDAKSNDTVLDQIGRGYAEGQRIAKLSVWTLVGIGITELLVAFLTGSVGLLADGVDSISDSVISLMIWIGLRFSRRKPDRYFHYGYYKVESLVALLASIAMIIAASLILYRGYTALLHPQDIGYPAIALVTLAIAGAGTISLGRALQMRRVAKKHACSACELTRPTRSRTRQLPSLYLVAWYL